VLKDALLIGVLAFVLLALACSAGSSGGGAQSATKPTPSLAGCALPAVNPVDLLIPQNVVSPTAKLGCEAVASGTVSLCIDHSVHFDAADCPTILSLPLGMGDQDSFVVGFLARRGLFELNSYVGDATGDRKPETFVVAAEIGCASCEGQHGLGFSGDSPIYEEWYGVPTTIRPTGNGFIKVLADYSDGAPFCCPNSFRLTQMLWDGAKFITGREWTCQATNNGGYAQPGC
jgi:hypothetical protein